MFKKRFVVCEMDTVYPVDNQGDRSMWGVVRAKNAFKAALIFKCEHPEVRKIMVAPEKKVGSTH